MVAHSYEKPSRSPGFLGPILASWLLIRGNGCLLNWEWLCQVAMQMGTTHSREANQKPIYVEIGLCMIDLKQFKI